MRTFKEEMTLIFDGYLECEPGENPTMQFHGDEWMVIIESGKKEFYQWSDDCQDHIEYELDKDEEKFINDLIDEIQAERWDDYKEGRCSEMSRNGMSWRDFI